MKQTYIITSIENDRIFVMQEKHASGFGTRAHAPIEVMNPKRYGVKLGSRVTIGLPQKAEAIHGVLALFFPIASAFAGLFAAPFAARALGIELTELLKAACITTLFAISAAIVYIQSRNTSTIVKLQIKSVLSA